MNYNGNMPDWHQYNPPQSGINDVTSTNQNINSGHFISSISPTCPPQLSSLNLSSEGLEKHQNDSNFNPRHFQPHLPSNISHGHNAVADNTPLASMAQMQNCIGHYGPSNTRNPMVDNLNGPMDPRSTAMGGLNEELGYRNNQVPLSGPISHHGPNVMNMNAPHGPIAPRSTNVNSHATGRTGPPPSFAPCKALCCNPDPNISYQQYCSYQNNAAYRENIRSSAGYQADARRFGNDFSFRKDNFDGKDVPPPPSMVPPHNVPNVDHRRNFSDPIKYRKDRLVSRGYPSASNMLQNYSMQNYNYAEYQKYPYGVKDYSKVGGMNVPSQGMVKQHGQEHGFAMPQQKYNSGKQVPYQSNGGMMPPSSMPSANVPPNPSMMPAAQNTYYNSQYPRNLSTETSHSCQEAADNMPMANRMQTSTMPHNTPHSRYPEFQQRLAMQRFSIESHLRKLSRIPDYQSLPEYKDCVHKYNEIVNIERQQSFTYQGQIQQTAPCVAVSATVNAPTVPPINLQFDRNGVLINSNYLPEAFSRVQQVVNPPQAPIDSAVDKQGKQNGKNIPEMMNHNVQKPEQMLPTQQHAPVLCPEGIRQGKQDQYSAPKSLDQRQFEVPKAPGDGYSSLSANTSDTAMQQKITKVLDVRQFLANWDESEDEDGASANLPEAVLNNSTPVVVVGYENVDLSGKTLENLNGSKPSEIASGVIAFENQGKSGGNDGVVAGQDCLTISYAENATEIAKDSTCKELTKVRSGSHIIQCISNEPGEAPTIHIVDNLEISSILQVTNGQVAETQDAVSFFQEGTGVEASTIALEADKFEKADGAEPSATALVDLTSKEKYVVESSSSKAAESTPQPAQVTDQITLPASMKDNLDAAQDMNLKKQSSFASEESHNPDDISLPDLPTSECTPISTTLNTPIHSDNEESSERVDDLTIPTNPIEIIQNSPMISFTQSPTKGEPYDHLNDEGTDRRSTDSLEGEYQMETRFKGDGSHNMLDHDAVLGTFEFSANIDENEAGTTTKKNNKERTSLHDSCITTNNNNKKTFALDGETESEVEVTGMRMTLTSGEYELKIVSTGAQNKPQRDYKNSTSTGRQANESQITVMNPDVSMTRKKLQLLSETSAKVTPGRRYDDSIELNNALQNIARKDDCQDDVNYIEKRCVSAQLTDQASTDAVNSASDAASRSSRSEDVCSTKIAKSNDPSASHSTKHSNLSGDKPRKCESDKFTKEDLSPEKNTNGNKSARIDARDLKSFRHARLTQDHKKSGDPAIFHKKRYLSENTAEKCSEEAVTHHPKHTQEADTNKGKSCADESPKESDVSHNKPKIIDNIRIDDSSGRIRLLKEYRRVKYKSCGMGENKSKDPQEASDGAGNKRSHLPSDPDERSQSSKDKQLCQRDAARLKLPDEQGEKRANILRKFVTKNINPDFDIQVTNVNLKLNDNDHQRDSQCSREDTKNSGALDAIKIEINVSCSERNTTKTLLHENIKNAVAETIGHLTSTISSGARSNSASITEIQCDKKVACEKTERNGCERSATLREASTYNNEAYEDRDDAEVKHQSPVIACATNEEPSDSLVSKKRRNSSLERDQINDTCDDNGNDNIETEPASSILKISKTEHAAIRRRSVQQDAERKVAATNFCVSNEESKIANSSHTGSVSKNMQKKEQQETTAASLSRNTRNSQDDVASRSNAIPSTSSNAMNSSLEDAGYDNPVHLDYNHFDVAPNEQADTNDDDKRNDRWKRLKMDDGRFGSFDLYESASGFINPTFFSADERENLNAVPVYTTKDGKITYSPNPRFTYRELIMEARAKESYGPSACDSYFARSPSYNYYNCSKLRKVFKRHRDIVAGRKRDTDSADAKPAMKYLDYSPSNNAAKTRDTSHLEFFNDDANKLFANSRNSQQESKESNRKNIVDLSFLEKKYTNESASSAKHCKMKAFADNLDYEKGYNESVFDTNLFLGPKSTCEETMESIKSYSSHIDRRNTDDLNELSFSQIFAAQKQRDPFPFLPAEQNPSEQKVNCDTANEPMLYHRAICNCTDDLHVKNDDAQCKKSNTVLRNEQGSEINNQNDATTNDKSADMADASLNIQKNEYLTMQESQSEEIKSSATVLTETPRSCSPKVVHENIHDSEKDQCPVSYVKDNEALAEHSNPENDPRVCNPVPSMKDKSNAEEAEIARSVENTENAENVENTENAESVDDTKKTEKTENVENAEESAETEETEKTEKAGKAEDPKQDLDEHVEVASSELNVDGDLVKDSPDELKSTEATEESAPSLNEQDDGINDSTKNNSDSIVDQEILPPQVSPVHRSPNSRKEEEEIAPAIELNISTEINQISQTNEQGNACDETSTMCLETESITSQKPCDVALVEQSLEEGDERKLSKLEDEDRTAEISFKDPGTDEVDNSIIISTPPPALDLQMTRAEESVCDLFANEKREQNISEFTVIKSIIKPDRKQSQESEAKEHLKDSDSIIDSKLLCMDSSDCGIYSEDRCTLAQISEHDFSEDDSMVPMEWETSQIQEDAVNRLCSIDESSIDFAGAVNSLQDNSLLDNLSLSRVSSTIKESAVPEKILEIEGKTNDESATAIESTPTIEEPKPSNDDNDDDNREPDQVSSSSYEKVAYLRATDCNANMKMVPKLVIKKSEASSKFITKLSAASISPTNSKSSYQPKIPKMIIRNARSRPGTPSIPSIEAVHEEGPAQAVISERSLLATDELYDNDSNQSSLHESNGYRNKIPKMKIKLDERHSNKIITAEDNAEVCARRKNTKKTMSKESRDADRHEERIPVLKLRKHERNRSSSPEGVTRKRQSSSHSDVPMKKYKRSGGRDEAGHSTKRSSSSDSTRTIASESETRKNPLVCISEKIPKVIIKRASASAEFKCEFSKGCKSVIAKSAKWQPEVKLERYRILDSMVKDLKLTLSPISLHTIEKIFSNGKDRRQQEGNHKLSRSNSTSDLLPIKCKQRRMSDYDCRKAGDALKSDLSFARDTDVKSTKTCITPKKNVSSKNHSRSRDECPKDDRRRSRSRDNVNAQTETDVTDKEMNQSFGKTDSAFSQPDSCKIDNFDVHHEQAERADEDKQENILVKRSSSTDFKVALKELKATSNMENCFVKLPDLSGPPSVKLNSRVEKEQQKERDDDFFFDKCDSKIMIKKERLSSSSDIDCTLQDDIDSLRDDSAGMLDSFGMDRNSVIKIESSDESQSTIEILPASPDDNSELENNIIEDGDNEQLYSADAIPTQFELELEIADNSNTDQLDVSMPKLDLIPCYSSRRVSIEESRGDRASKAGRCNTPEFSSRGENLLEKDKHVTVDDRSALESDPAGSVEQISCGRTTGSVRTKENFCCNDSLIKEVLAAKETLKKCLSKTKGEESSAKLRTVVEKKQGSSFDLNNLSETHSKSSDAPPGCRSDVAPQAASTPVAGQHKTESTPDAEKSDKKHSKQIKSSCVKKKSKSPDKNDRSGSKGGVMRNAPESTTISLKTFRRVGQAASNGSRTVYLSEKRKNSADQSDTSQLRDSQRKAGSKWLSYKIPKISKSTDRSRADGNARENKPREDNMPILEPAIAMDLDSDRDSSRSPPVITIQDNDDHEISRAEVKLADDKIITSDDKVASDTKDVHKKSEMSTADFISQLAYHEKATIKHRRYCNLCERWFPTTARHRRHLAGYQHRHIELTQRRSIHALFTLFTGKPCPRLLPAHIVRSDCSLGELTPLQIAVQDVTKCFDRTEKSPKKQNDVDK